MRLVFIATVIASSSHHVNVLHQTFSGFIIFISFKQDIISISVRKGGIVGIGQHHNNWLSTISQSPDVISMLFVPITSLLSSVPGSGFLSHAVNLYLRCEYTCFLWPLRSLDIFQFHLTMALLEANVVYFLSIVLRYYN